MLRFQATGRHPRFLGVLLIIVTMLVVGKAETDGDIWVTIIEPASDALVIGQVAVVAEVVAAEEVAEVEFYVDGKAVGLVTSGGYGHRIGKSIALAYVETDLAQEGEALEVEILGERCPAKVATSPLYDPKNERLRA